MVVQTLYILETCWKP